jgi:hypothetical protein
MKYTLIIIALLLVAGCMATKGPTSWFKPVVPPEAVEEPVSPKVMADVWAERVLSGGMVLGGVMTVLGIGIAAMGNTKLGASVGVAGIAVFFGAYTTCRYLWVASSIIGIGALVLTAAGAYVDLFQRGLVATLIRSFEPQVQDKAALKASQGKFQPHISKRRKQVL